MMKYLVLSLLVSIGPLISMAFLTLTEQKTLGLMNIRLGPSKTGWKGLAQPFSDAMKLFVKSKHQITVGNVSFFLMAPLIALFLSLCFWMIHPTSGANISSSIIIFMAISASGVLMPILAGWASNSKYPLIGSVRSVSQTISYEISMALILISSMMLFQALDMYMMWQVGPWVSWMSLPLLYMWCGTTLAETNRAPFDLAEAESELVSGFNTEYGGQEFVMIFMAEYLSVVFMSMLSVVLLTNIKFIEPATTIFLVLILLARGSWPRMRYDRLMAMTWSSFLPCSILLILVLLPK